MTQVFAFDLDERDILAREWPCGTRVQHIDNSKLTGTVADAVNRINQGQKNEHPNGPIFWNDNCGWLVCIKWDRKRPETPDYFGCQLPEKLINLDKPEIDQFDIAFHMIDAIRNGDVDDRLQSIFNAITERRKDIYGD